MSTAAKIETAAEKYRRIRNQKAQAETLHDVTCEGADDSCGMEWKARRVGLEFWVTSGILPMHLVESMMKGFDKSKGLKAVVDPVEIMKNMAADQVVKSIEFSAKVVKHTAVEPRIVETPTDPNDVSQEEVMTCCFQRLLKWQMKGGDQASGLENFPGESGPDAVGRVTE